MTDDKIILTAEQAESLLPDGDEIHTFRNPNAAMLIGADWGRDELLKVIQASQCEIGGEQCRNSGHGLVVWTDKNNPLFVETRKDVDWDELERSCTNAAD